MAFSLNLGQGLSCNSCTGRGLITGLSGSSGSAAGFFVDSSSGLADAVVSSICTWRSKQVNNTARCSFAVR